MNDGRDPSELTPSSGQSYVIEAMRYAFDGVVYALRTQRNLRIELAFAVLALVLCAVLAVTRVELFIVLVLIGVVLSAEMLNTSLEAIVDLVSPERHSLAKAAKDSAAGAVLILAATSVVVGAMMFWPRIVERLAS